MKNLKKFDNFVRFTDTVEVRPMGITPQLKDFYVAGNTGQALRARIAATHSGKITRNNGFYLPHKMRAGAETFIDPYKKPIQLHHDEHVSPIGRAIHAQYIDTSSGIRDSWDVKQLRNDLRPISDTLLDAFNAGKLSASESVEIANKYFIQDTAICDDPTYQGLGYVEIIANITDPDAIQKLLDERYLTGSVGASTNAAVCNICKQDWAKEDGRCEHTPGKIYDEKGKCVLIAGDFIYEEYSFVNKPADMHSGVIEVNVGGVQDFVKTDTTKENKSRIPEITLVVIDNLKDTDLKSISIKTSMDDDHKHVARLDEDGDGDTDWIEDHSHNVVGFVVSPAFSYHGSKNTQSEEAHTHTIKNPLKKVRDKANQSREENQMLFKDAFDRVSKLDFFKDQKGLEDAVKKAISDKETTTETMEKDLERLVASVLGTVEDYDKTFPPKVELTDEEKATEAKKLENKTAAALAAKETGTSDDKDITTPQDQVKALEELLAQAKALIAPKAEVKDQEEEEVDELTTLKNQVTQLTQELADTKASLAVVTADVADSTKTDLLQERLDVARRENRYLHDDIENLQQSLADTASSVRVQKCVRIQDFKVLNGEEVDGEKLDIELNDKSSEELDKILKDLTNKVDTGKIAGTLKSGLSNNPLGTVADPNLLDSSNANITIEVTRETLQKIQDKHTYLRMQRNGQVLAAEFIQECKRTGLIPDTYQVQDKS